MRNFVAAYLSKITLIQVILTRMHIGRKHNLQFRAIGWLLIAAVFALTVQPMHAHLQHIDDASSLVHEHAIDLHFAVDNIVATNHKDGAVFRLPGCDAEEAWRYALAGCNYCLPGDLFVECYTYKQATSHHPLHQAKTRLVFYSATIARSSPLLITRLF